MKVKIDEVKDVCLLTEIFSWFLNGQKGVKFSLNFSND